MFQKSLLILSLILLSTVSGMRYDTKQASSKSFGTNTVTLPLIDDSTVSINYQTDCQDCECSVVSPLATLEKLRDIEFVKDIKQVFASDNIIFVIHQGEFESVYFSVFSVDEEGTITTILFEEQGGDFKNADNIFFNHHNGAFIEYAKDHIVVAYVDKAGKFTKHEAFSYSTKDDIFDILLLNEFLVVAKGEKGVEIVDVSTKDLKREEFWIEDLELRAGASVQGLGVDKASSVLYVLAPRSTGGMEVELLTIKGFDDVILVNKYELDFGDIVDADVISIAHNDKRTGVLGQIEDRYYYWQFITPERNGDLILWSQLEIPFEAEDVISNDHCSMVEGEDYVYTFENGFPGDQSLDISMNIIKAEEDGYYQPLIMGEDSYLISYTAKNLRFSRTSKDEAEYQCSVYKQDYEGTYKFNIFVEKNVCPEYEKKFEGETCLFPYEYDIQFTGNDYKSKEVSEYQPRNVPVKVIREQNPPKQHSGGHSGGSTGGGHSGMPEMPGHNGGHDDEPDYSDDYPSDDEPVHGGGHSNNLNWTDHSSNGGHGHHDFPETPPSNWRPRKDYKREIMKILANPIFIGVMLVLLVFIVYQIWRIWKARQFSHQELKEDEEEADSDDRRGGLELEGQSQNSD